MTSQDRSSLERSYLACKRLSRSFGSTYYWSASVLTAEQRRHVYALYAFCRYADDIVDVDTNSVDERKQALSAFGDAFFRDYELGSSSHPILEAVVHTARELKLPESYFRRFMKSMTMDFDVHTYETFDDLMGYMDGSAAVIGEMMVPVLRPTSPEAQECARNLGIAFQLTNFLRDVGEDLDRDRVYIPQETLRQFGADPHIRTVTPQWIAAMKFEIARTREFYERARPGIGYLEGRSRNCVLAAHRLYGGILDRIEANDYDVFSQRARVAQWRKLLVATTAFTPTALRRRGFASL